MRHKHRPKQHTPKGRATKRGPFHITAEFNGKSFSHSLRSLLQGSKAHFMRGWLGEAIRFNRAALEGDFMVGTFMTDKEAERDTDYYYVCVRQRDGQLAWCTPIWVER